MVVPTTCSHITLPQLGIEVRFVDYRQPEQVADLVDAKTKAVFCESIGNPLGNVVDFAAFAGGHRRIYFDC